MSAAPDVAAAVAESHRREWGFVLAATVRVAGSIDLAEECVQEAYGAALTAWARDGVPASPGAWLTTTARRRALDVLRREQTLRRKLPLLVERVDSEPDPAELVVAGGAAGVLGSDGPEAAVISDERLRLVFTCCHPALAREAQIALTLRLLCGLTTDEIARAFLVPEATMAARVTRAKKKIAAARIPYRVPSTAELPERLDAVLTVVHLVFTTGHTAPVGPGLMRHDLVDRALQLGRMLHALMPDESEVRGLLALMLLTDARRAGRTAADGSLVLLEHQDRSRWDTDAIAEGLDLVSSAALRSPRRFTLQAAIAGVHAGAPSWEATDWRLLLDLYDALLRVWPSPVVRLNRVVPVLMLHGPEAALAEVADLEADGRLSSYRYLASSRRPAAPAGPAGRGRGRLLRRAGAHRQRGRARLPRGPAPVPGW